MTRRYYSPRDPRTLETLGAALVSGAVAAVTFYLVRLLLARDVLEVDARGASGTNGQETSGTG